MTVMVVDKSAGRGATEEIGGTNEGMYKGFRVDIHRRSVAAVPAGFRGGIPRSIAGQDSPRETCR